MEIKRILDDGLSRCDKAKCHKFSYEFIRLDAEAALGNTGITRDHYGFPIWFRMLIEHNPKLGTTGYNESKFVSSVNPDEVAILSSNRAKSMGVVVVHEAICHGLTGLTDSGAIIRIPTGEEGTYVDDNKPPANGNPTLSNAACDKFWERMKVKS